MRKQYACMTIPSWRSSIVEVNVQSKPIQKHPLRAGAAQVEITPPPGIPLTGFIARLGPSSGIHDPLFARALWLEAGDQSVLLIVCDLLALEASFVAAARAAIRQATGLAEQNILIACTHTHSGPATIFLRDCGEVDAAYLERLRLNLVDVAEKAAANLRPARVGAGRGRVEQGALNRRRPGEAVDPDLDVISFEGQAILVNYACHPVCLDHTNRLVSADYPGCLSRILQAQTGATTLFTTGAAGDINPDRMGDFAFAEALGERLAAEAQRVLQGLEYHESVLLHCAAETLTLPLQPLPTPAELGGADHRSGQILTHRRQLSEAEAAGDVVQAKVQRAMLGWAEDTLAGARRGDLPTTVQAEFQVIRLDNAILLGVPGEIFSELGKAIKNQAAPRQVTVLGYANNDIGYIPTRQAYAQGGYEIHEAFKFYDYPAALSPEAGDLAQECAARLIRAVSDEQAS